MNESKRVKNHNGIIHITYDGAGRMTRHDHGERMTLTPLRSHVTTSSNGALYSEKRYMPWGEERWANGTLPTTYRYTGQREQEELGLYFYQSRWYDPRLSRFLQADSIVPGPYNSQAFDRYAYVFNNPLRYIDPTGHEICNPKDCGYMHDYDGDTPASEWALDIEDECNQPNELGIQIINLPPGSDPSKPANQLFDLPDFLNDTAPILHGLDSF